MADAPDSKSGEGNLMRVRLPPPAFFLYSTRRINNKHKEKNEKNMPIIYYH